MDDTIAFFIGSRANYGRLYSVIKEAKKYFDVKVLLGASGLWEDIEYDYKLSCLLADDKPRDMSLTSALLQIEVTTILDNIKPDLVFVHGDRYEVLDVAQAAAYMNIPVAHTEGGEVTGTIDDKVRYAITALADYHFVVTDLSASRIHKDNVHVVGSTAIDNVKRCGLDRVDKGYVLALFHPNTTVQESVQPLIDALVETGKPVKWINPNVDAGYKDIVRKVHDAGFEVLKGLSPDEYYELMAECSILVGNTSSGIKEGAYLGVPYVCIGLRQKDREHSDNVVFVPNNTWEIFTQIEYNIGKKIESLPMFGNGTSGERIVSILDDIRRNTGTWR